jgi:hypothetical protein
MNAPKDGWQRRSKFWRTTAIITAVVLAVGLIVMIVLQHAVYDAFFALGKALVR